MRYHFVIQLIDVVLHGVCSIRVRRECDVLADKEQRPTVGGNEVLPGFCNPYEPFWLWWAGLAILLMAATPHARYVSGLKHRSGRVRHYPGPLPD